MLEILQKLCSLRGVSGWEDEVRDYISNFARPYAHEMFSDSIGNLFILKKGKASRSKSLMVCAHMDEVGLIIKSITDEGYLKFGFAGGVDRRVAIGKRVLIGEKRIPGLIGVKAVHLTTKDERKNIPKLDDLYVDIGCTSKAQASSLVTLGDYAVFDSDYLTFGNDYVKARAIDDRAGCSAMLSLLREELAFDTWFVFTVQEEVGLRGATVAAERLMPHSALILEGTTAADIPGMIGHRRVCSVEKGIVIGCMDRSTIYDKEYFNLLCRLANENNIPWQIKEYISGGTDAGIIHKTGAGVRTASISAPVRYIHSPACVTSAAALQSLYTLARLFINCKEGTEQ